MQRRFVGVDQLNEARRREPLHPRQASFVDVTGLDQPVHPSHHKDNLYYKVNMLMEQSESWIYSI